MDVQAGAIGAICVVAKCFVGLAMVTETDNDLLFRVVRVVYQENLSTNELHISTMHGLATVFGSVYDSRQMDVVDPVRRAILMGSRSARDDNSTLPSFMSRVRVLSTNIETGIRLFTEVTVSR